LLFSLTKTWPWCRIRSMEKIATKNRKRVTAWLTPEEHRKLKSISAASGEYMEDVIRGWLLEYLDTHSD